MKFLNGHKHKRHCEEADTPTKQSRKGANGAGLLRYARNDSESCIDRKFDKTTSHFEPSRSPWDKGLLALLVILSILCAPATAHAQDITTGLVGHWKLDESGNTSTAVDAISGNDGTLTNFPADPTADWVTGTLRNGLTFDDAGDEYVSMGDVLDMGTSDWTTAAWFYYTDDEGGFIIAKYRGFTGGYGMAVNFQEEFNCWFGRDPAANISVGNGSADFIQTNRWYHAACVYDRDGNLSLYVDGEFINSADISSEDGVNRDETVNLQLGRRNQSGDFEEFGGIIDDARIYNRALTAADIAELAAATYPGKLRYNTTHRVSEYHDGTDWVAAGAEKPTTSGLVGYWTLDETAGTFADSSGFGNDGTQNGGVEYASSGIIGNAAGFDGVDDVVTVTSSFSDLEQYTYTAWIKPNGWGENGFGRILDKGNNVTGPSFLICQSGSGCTNGMRFERDWNPNPGTWNANNTITLNTWQHVAVVYDESSISNAPIIYHNGVSQTVTPELSPSGSKISEDNMLYIGNRSGTGRTFDGAIDDVRIYNRALSVAEVNDLYLFGRGTTGTPTELDNVNVNTVPHLIERASVVVIEGNYLYFGTHYNSGAAGVGVIDISDPSSISIVGSVTGSSYYSPTSMKVVGDYVFACAGGAGGGGNGAIVSIDVSTKTAPFQADLEDTSNVCNGGGGLDIQGDYAYTVGYNQDGISVHDISDPTNITFVDDLENNVTFLDGSYAIDVDGDYAYIGAYDGQRLTIVDISNHASLSIAGSVTDSDIAGPSRVIKHPTADVVYIGSEAFAPNSPVVVVDVSNKSAPTVDNSFYPAGPNTGCYPGLEIEGNLLYVADACSTADIYVYDISTPLSPVFIDSVDASGTCAAGITQHFEIGLTNQHLFMTCNDQDLITSWERNAAYCASPSRPEGSIIFNTTSNVMQYCDGVDWIAMGPFPGAGGGGCSNPTGSAGGMVFNTSTDGMQYCDGADWIAVGRQQCTEIGDTCPDGSIYMGIHAGEPGVKLYVTDTTQSFSSSWSSVSIDTGADSLTNGQANQAWIVANTTLSQYSAFQTCENLVRHGKSDWYLPARDELDMIHDRLVAPALIGFSTDIHWSSTEDAINTAHRQTFSGGAQGTTLKSVATLDVRCIRRD